MKKPHSIPLFSSNSFQNGVGLPCLSSNISLIFLIPLSLFFSHLFAQMLLQNVMIFSVSWY